MAKCKSCSAPLPANINRCVYCNVRNDIDLHGRHSYTIKTKHFNRICPNCDKVLQTIDLNAKIPIQIERCKTCFGLFFDPGEVEELLESSVSNVFDPNFKLIQNINKDRYPNNKKIKYVKCPVCRVLMNRVNYAYRSGVVIDQCIKHGVWVNSGGIAHLLEWKKAGGELLHAQYNEKMSKKKKTHHNSPLGYDISQYHRQSKVQDADLVETVFALIF